MITLPRFDYIIFQLLSYPPDKPELIAEERVVIMDVIPTMLDYREQTRDAIYQTGKTIFTDKFPLAPVSVTLSGTFGNIPRPKALKLQNGFQRLLEMQLLFRQAHSTDDERLYFDAPYGTPKSYLRKNKNISESAQPIYVLNYYDFIFQQFFAVNLNSFRFYGNARQNTQMQFYDLQFTSAGLMHTVNTKDPILKALQGVYEIATSEIESLNESLLAVQETPAIQTIQFLLESMNLAVTYTASIHSTIKELVGVTINTGKDYSVIPL